MQDSPKFARQSSLGRFLESNPAFRSLWAAKYWVVGGSAALGLVVYALASLLPAQYMGSTVIQVGTVRIGDTRDAIQQPIEPPAVAASRFSSVPFKMEVLKAAGLPVDGSNADATLAMDSFSANSRPTSSSVEVQVLATSPERVVQILNAAAPTLAKFHEAIAEPRLQLLRDQIKSVAAEMEEIDKADARLIALAQGAQPNPGEPIGYALTAISVMALYEKSRLKTLERELKEKLRLSEPTRGVTAPSVLPRPVGPRRFLYATVAMIVTFVLLTTLILLLAPSNRPAPRVDRVDAP
jgi:hypothetical protein